MDEMLCKCGGVTRAQVDYWFGQGVCTLEGLSRKTGAVSGCGGCEPELLAALAAAENNMSDG